jgi:acetolactate synthase-1/2/3 large subunit
VKLADYVISRLAAEGITTAFVVDGAAAADLIHAVNDHPCMQYVCAQHEQAAGFMAEGYAKVSSRPGLAIATSGPGGQNLVTAIANAFYDSVPMICLTGQVRSEFMTDDPRVRQKGFQETPIVEIVRPITKAAFCLKDPAGVRYWLDYLIWKAKEGRPGPVLLDLPIDVQRAEIDPDSLSPFRPMEEPWTTGLDDVLYDLQEHLAKARRPAILIGGGARGCEKEIDYIATRLGLPVFVTWNATDIIASDNPSWCGKVGTYGGEGRNFGVANADVLVAIGTRVSGRITGGRPDTFARAARRYLVNIDEHAARGNDVEWHRRCHRPAKTFLAEWVKLLGMALHTPHFGDWLQRCQEWRDRYDPVAATGDVDGIHPYRFVRELSRQAPANAVVVADCGGNLVTTMHSWKTKTGQRLFSSNGNSPMGFALAGAIGAWFADPTRPVICIIGDGGLQVNLQELQTVATYDVPLKIVVLDNGCYGITKAFQETNFAGKAVACDQETGYRRPILESIAGDYEICGDTVGTEKYAKDCILWMMGSDEPEILVVTSPSFRTYEPRIADGKTPIEDMHPKLSDDEFTANMLIPHLRSR